MKNIFLILVILFLAACSDSDNIYYEVKGNEVLYHSVFRKGQEYYTKAYLTTVKVEDADAETFEQISKYYGADKVNVFNETKRLKHRDPSTFKVISKFTTADKYGVYSNNKLVRNSDGLSFKLIGNYYAIDANQAYYWFNNSYIVLKEVDKETFTPVGDDYQHYAKDKNQVYFRASVIENSDPTSFEILDGDFSKDRKYIFYESNRIKEVDYDSFQMSTAKDRFEKKLTYYAEDKNNFYGFTYFDNGTSELKITKK